MGFFNVAGFTAGFAEAGIAQKEKDVEKAEENRKQIVANLLSQSSRYKTDFRARQNQINAYEAVRRNVQTTTGQDPNLSSIQGVFSGATGASTAEKINATVQHFNTNRSNVDLFRSDPSQLEMGDFRSQAQELFPEPQRPSLSEIERESFGPSRTGVAAAFLGRGPGISSEEVSRLEEQAFMSPASLAGAGDFGSLRATQSARLPSAASRVSTGVSALVDPGMIVSTTAPDDTALRRRSVDNVYAHFNVAQKDPTSGVMSILPGQEALANYLSFAVNTATDPSQMSASLQGAAGSQLRELFQPLEAFGGGIASGLTSVKLDPSQEKFIGTQVFDMLHNKDSAFLRAMMANGVNMADPTVAREQATSLINSVYDSLDSLEARTRRSLQEGAVGNRALAQIQQSRANITGYLGESFANTILNKVEETSGTTLVLNEDIMNLVDSWEEAVNFSAGGNNRFPSPTGEIVTVGDIFRQKFMETLENSGFLQEEAVPSIDEQRRLREADVVEDLPSQVEREALIEDETVTERERPPRLGEDDIEVEELPFDRETEIERVARMIFDPETERTLVGGRWNVDDLLKDEATKLGLSFSLSDRDTPQGVDSFYDQVTQRVSELRTGESIVESGNIPSLDDPASLTIGSPRLSRLLQSATEEELDTLIKEGSPSIQNEARRMKQQRSRR